MEKCQGLTNTYRHKKATGVIGNGRMRRSFFMGNPNQLCGLWVAASDKQPLL
jgi:hypothetical protein